MFAVIFEVQPKKERRGEYLALAKQLKPKLEAIEGFMNNERFASKRTDGRVLSLSIWRDEKAVVRWRTHGEHHGVQKKGRNEVFADYHLRVGEVVADNAPPGGTSIAPTRFDETEVGDARACTITEVALQDANARQQPIVERLGLDRSARGLIDHEVFEGINNPEKLLILASWRDAAAASSWHPAPSPAPAAIRHRVVRILRDYGMYDRREAPQFHSDVARA
jgi:heme-degrading monooxygenase HmoA